MSQNDKNENFTKSIPVGELGIVALESCSELGKRVNDYIVSWRTQREGDHMKSLHFTGYQKENYLIDAKCPRFGSGRHIAECLPLLHFKDKMPCVLLYRAALI